MNRFPFICHEGRVFIPVNSLSDISPKMHTHDFGFILPDNRVYIMNHAKNDFTRISNGDSDGSGIAEITNSDGLIDIVNGTVTTINMSEQLNDLINESATEIINSSDLAPLDHDHIISDVEGLQDVLDSKVDAEFVTSAIFAHDGDPLAHPVLRDNIDFLNTRIDNIVGMGKMVGTFGGVEDLPRNITEFEPIIPSVNDWAVVSQTDGTYQAYIITVVDQDTGDIEWQYGWRMGGDLTGVEDRLLYLEQVSIITGRTVVNVVNQGGNISPSGFVETSVVVPYGRPFTERPTVSTSLESGSPSMQQASVMFNNLGVGNSDFTHFRLIAAIHQSSIQAIGNSAPVVVNWIAATGR